MLSAVPVNLTVNGAVQAPLNGSSTFWADTWYNATAGAPRRCIVLGHGCDTKGKLVRLCRTGGYGEPGSSVTVTMPSASFS